MRHRVSLYNLSVVILWNGEPYTVGASTGRDLDHVYLLRVHPEARRHPDFLRNVLVVPLNKAREAPRVDETGRRTDLHAIS